MSLSPSGYLCMERKLAVSSERKENQLRRCARRVVHVSTSQKGIVLRELSLWLDPLMPSSKPLL
uniref:Alternative protein PCBP2 n=1 Tax=Homo sapiens TaxID=9606 RepID=L8E745_HUMAN|nr:alternative protein PCBP2 [Homo sapiens]